LCFDCVRAERAKIELELWNGAVLPRASKKRGVASREENMQHHVFIICVCRVAVPLPIARIRIQFDAAAERLAAIDRKNRIGKIRPGFAVPNSELHDFQCVASGGLELRAELSRKPARLYFDLRNLPCIRRRLVAQMRRNARENPRISAGQFHA
jgi:hypothetical protein